MANHASIAGVYTDFQGLAKLRNEAGKQSSEAKQEVARQFEALFLQMMLKSMREAGGGEGIMDGPQGEFYRNMHDQQLALHLSNNSSIGIADVMLRQMGGVSSDTGHETGVQKVVKHDGQAHLPFVSRLWSGTSSMPHADAVATDVRVKFQTDRNFVDRLWAAPAVDTAQSGKIPVKAADWNSPQEFVATLWPVAEQSSRQLGTRPEVLLSIAALETGWGKHVMRLETGQSSNNLFGIKATRDWRSERVVAPTLEFEHGAMVKRHEPFRAYASVADSFSDFVAFIKGNPRYQNALSKAGDPAAFIQGLQEAGYATDPEYAKKILSVMNGRALREISSQLKNGEKLPIS